MFCGACGMVHGAGKNKEKIAETIEIALRIEAGFRLFVGKPHYHPFGPSADGARQVKRSAGGRSSG